MRYLLTGHTGFKGSWLTLLLRRLGHSVSGIALDPEPGSLFELAGLTSLLDEDLRLDIRDQRATCSAVESIDSEVIIHLAAQPLVPESYRRPRWTFETNVTGTLNVLEAAQNLPNLRALIVVTTDKVYRNVSQVAGYVESDPLGGDDPYSASKAMSDILAHSWAVSFHGPPIVIARAGNVIGGGDTSNERLLPDIVRALRKGKAPELRYPHAVRPWQHVLDCVNGYIALAEAVAAGSSAVPAGSSWNFGPGVESFVTVGEVTRQAMDYWGLDTPWSMTAGETFHEADLLALDSTRATRELNWRNQLGFKPALRWTLDWYRRVDAGESAREVTTEQVEHFAAGHLR